MTIHKNRRILVIDDQESMHSDYRKVIGPQPIENPALGQASVDLFGEDSCSTAAFVPFEVDSAYQGEQGLQMVDAALKEGRPYALAFVDVRMPPGWNGIDTVKRIWEIDSEILVVICSAYSDHSWEQMIDQLGQSDRFLILKKPFEQIEIRQFAVALTERWNLARNDALTGLLNRRAFGEHLSREYERARRYSTPLSCAMLDVDFFKRINDEIGHSAGDAVLQSVAELLKLQSRASDYVCRFGGEELCVLLLHTDEEGARAWAEKARLAIGRLGLPVLQAADLQLSVSIGVAAMTTGEAAEGLVADADEALRAAKEWGRNQVVCASSLRTTQRAASNTGLFETPLSRVRAAEVMTTPIPLLHFSASIDEATATILQHRVAYVAVVDDSGAIVGVLSEKQIMPQMLSPQGAAAKVGEVMRGNIISYTEDAPVDRIFDFLSRVSISQVFIVRDGRPFGSITRTSLLRWMCAWLGRDSRPTPTLSCDPWQDTRARVHETAKDLALRASRLTEPTSASDDVSVTTLIEIMFKMRELMNDLIDCSRGGTQVPLFDLGKVGPATLLEANHD